MRRRLSIRARVALWCAVLAAITGAMGVVVTLAITDSKLRVAARQVPPERTANFPLGLGTPNTGRGGALTTPAGRAAEGQRVARVLDESRGRGLLTVLAIATASVVASWFAATRMLRPVRAMTDTARRVATPGSGQRIRLEGPHDDLHELADTIDQMLDRLDVAFDAQRRFVADASHELRTPLAVLTTEVDVALDDPGAGAPELLASLGRVHDELARTSRLVESLLHLSRAETVARREPHDLADSAEQAIGAMARLGVGNRVVQLSLGSAPVSGDPVLIDRLVLNLVENAYRYNVDGGLVRVITARVDGDALLTVENDGQRVDAADIPVLFDRFRRGGTDTFRRRGDGHGLGLSIALAVATTHGGTLDAAPRLGGGLTVTARFPS